MSKINKSELTIQEIAHKYLLLTKLEVNQQITVKSLAKELEVKSTDLMEFIENNPKLFYTSKTKTKGLAVDAVFLVASDNPKTSEWLNKMIKGNEKTFSLSYYDNYGHISGYYIEVDGKDESKHLWRNTSDKVLELVKKYDLKPAGYHIGGFGDSTYVKPAQGFEVSTELLDELTKNGYSIVGKYSKA